MDTFSPEFSRFWLPGNERGAHDRSDSRDDDVRREDRALQELADRVSAARSIV